MSLLNASPLVSVICIFCDEERFLEEAIQSVLAQSYDNWELLLANDGSKDSSPKIARRYASEHGHIRYLQHSGGINRGMSATRNLGLEHARGHYVTFLDGDDVLTSKKVEEQVAILEAHPDVGMLCSATKYWHSWTDNTTNRKRDKIKPLGVAPGVYEPPQLLTQLYPLSTGTAPCMSSLLIRRGAINQVGGFEDHFTGMYEDQAFLSKMYLHETILITDQWWDCYRQHPNSACSISLRAGTQPVYRHRFLRWFASYLSIQKKGDFAVHLALWKALLPYRSPLLYSVLNQTNRLYDKIKWHVRRVSPLH